VALAKNDPEMEALEAMARGDLRQTLTVLMRAYGDDVGRHCRRALGSDDLADEVRQQVFVQAFRDLATCSRRSTFRAWLFGIARHRCLDAVKASGRWKRRFVSASSLTEPADPRPRIDDELASRRAAARIDWALAQLKPRVREAVLQRFAEGLTYAEMAERTGEQPGTLQARVARALPLLRAALAGMMMLVVVLGTLVLQKSVSEEMARQAMVTSDWEFEAIEEDHQAQRARLNESFDEARALRARVVKPRARSPYGL
jgi:RNA polymerase sigma-70 factor (ECF subfamily)